MRLTSLLLVLACTGCGPAIAQFGPQTVTHGDVAYECRHGGGVFDGVSCRADPSPRIHLFIPETHRGPLLTYRPYGDERRSVDIPEWATIRFDTPDGPRDVPQPPRTWVTEVAETERFLVAHISDDTWRVVERPSANAEPVPNAQTLLEGPFTRAEVEARLGDAGMPALTHLSR